ncbi:MAG TPA: 8-oxo-dGTP diphosphatase [Ignavibacteriaceae bacterium]|nr:8-oxo-dGTP diphosphatase [Ignavibacteriaceae bacterium]
MKLATLCYVKDSINKRTLMLHRIKKENDYHKNKWNGLGGKFELGESPEDCARREIFEECGLKVNSLRMHGFITFPLFDLVEDWHVFIFSSDDYSGELINSTEGELEWIDEDKLLELNLWDGDKIFLEWMNQEKFFSAKFVYEDGKYVSHEVSFY